MFGSCLLKIKQVYKQGKFFDVVDVGIRLCLFIFCYLCDPCLQQGM